MQFIHHYRPDLSAEDIETAQSYARDEWQSLQEAAPKERVARFGDYAKAVLEAQEHGSLSPMQAAYLITASVQFPELNDDMKAATVLDLAGDLELPAGHISGNVRTVWNQLITAVTELP